MTVPPVIILGAGGHAKVLLDLLLDQGREVLGFIDPDMDLWGSEIFGVKVLGGEAVLHGGDLPPSARFVNGLGNRARRTGSGLGARRRIFEEGKASGGAFDTVAAASASISTRAALGEGVQIMPGAAVQAGARLGDNCIVNTRAVVEHDCAIGAHVHVAPGSVLCGGVSLGTEVHVGAGAIIIQNVSVGDGCVIGAGAVLTRNLPPFTVHLG